MKRFFHRLLWQYGTCKDRRARRHRFTRHVQFVMWKAGEQGHQEDWWHDFDPGWWPLFIPGSKP